jgi:hypothetical protein
VRIAVIELDWVAEDRYANFTRLAFAGAVLALLFAVAGLPPIGLHAPPHYLGVMAPSCGLTRGTIALVRGSLSDAIRFNPASPAVLVGGLALLGRGAFGLLTGRWLNLRLRVERLGWLLLAVAGAALAVNQQLHAGLLRG